MNWNINLCIRHTSYAFQKTWFLNLFHTLAWFINYLFFCLYIFLCLLEKTGLIFHVQCTLYSTCTCSIFCQLHKLFAQPPQSFWDWVDCVPNSFYKYIPVEIYLSIIFSTIFDLPKSYFFACGNITPSNIKVTALCDGFVV